MRYKVDVLFWFPFPYPYPTIEVLALSHEWNPAPRMVHPIALMPVFLMNPLPVRELFPPFAHVSPLLYLLLMHFPLLFVKLLFLPELLLQIMQFFLCFLHSSLLPLPFRGSLVALFLLCLYSHNFLVYQWIFSKFLLFSSSMWSIIFLLSLSCTSMLVVVAIATSASSFRDAASHFFTNHSTVKSTVSLSLEDF